MKLFSVYGNCQSHIISHLLQKSPKFSDIYLLKDIKPVQTIQEDEIEEILNKVSTVDLLIHQEISDNYRLKTLSTKSVTKKLKDDAISIKFPSVYFDGYFPHNASFMGIKSILDHTHDYFMIMAFINGMDVNECIDMINDEELYTKKNSIDLVTKSFEELGRREENLDIKINDYIKENYLHKKLFHQFNHPDGLVLQVLVSRILSYLKISDGYDEFSGNNVILGALKLPVYRSTYKNLKCKFDEDFLHYSTLEGVMEIDEVVSRFYKCYSNIDKLKMKEHALARKPEIIDVFNSYAN